MLVSGQLTTERCVSVLLALRLRLRLGLRSDLGEQFLEQTQCVNLQKSALYEQLMKASDLVQHGPPHLILLLFQDGLSAHQAEGVLGMCCLACPQAVHCILCQDTANAKGVTS